MNKKVKEFLNKKNKSKVICLTAYSKNIALILDKYCDLVLVGDSLGSVIYNYKSTKEVTLDTMINHSPNINAYYNSMFGIDENRVLDPLTNITSTVGANVSMYHSAVDIDGDFMTMGWDTDLDGSIDVNISGQHGFTSIYLPLSSTKVT